MMRYNPSIISFVLMLMTLTTRWLPPSCYWQANLRYPHKDWVLSRGSLTAYLIALSRGDFKVRVIHQGWHKPSLDERLTLKLPLAQRAWVREVALVCQGEVWVQARSVIPLTVLQGKGRRLRFLGSRSLGSLLFNGGQRQEMTIMAASSKHRSWTRRSRFCYGGQPLLVQETFLPALFAAFHQHKITL